MADTYPFRVYSSPKACTAAVCSVWNRLTYTFAIAASGLNQEVPNSYVEFDFSDSVGTGNPVDKMVVEQRDLTHTF